MVGMLRFSRRGNERFARNIIALRDAGLPHELMDGPQASRRFDAFEFGDDVEVYFAAKNGFFLADRAVAAMRQLACRDLGSDVR